MSGVLIRIVIALVAFVVAVMLIPMVLAEIGITLSGNLMAIIKIVAGILALIYIWRGSTPPWRPAP